MKNINKTITLLKFIIITLLIPIMLINLNDISQSVIKTVNMCIKITIPSIYPLLLASGLLSSAEIPNKLREILHKFTCKAFGLSGDCFTPMISGLICGYNCAFISAEQLYINKKISSDEAVRLSLFFTSPGFSFCVLITGITFYNSTFIGVLILLSNITASIIIAVFYNFLFKGKPVLSTNNISLQRKHSLTDTVNSTTEALIRICAWIMLFNTLTAVINSLYLPPFLRNFLSVFAEVTSGIDFCKQNTSIYIAVLCVSFGGICIFMQQIPMIRTLKVNPLKVLLFRLTVSITSCIIFYFLTLVFHINTEVSNTFLSNELYYNSASGAFSLVLLCAVFICYALSANKTSTFYKK